VVCLTDGGANVGLERSLQDPSRRVPADEYVPSKAALRAEAIATAARVGRAGVALLVVDTESRFAAGRDAGADGAAEEEVFAEGGGSLARSIARAAGGTYFRMPIGPDPRVASERLGEAIGRAAGRRER
jgi:Mg-chelatase subunit ChlD